MKIEAAAGLARGARPQDVVVRSSDRRPIGSGPEAAPAGGDGLGFSKAAALEDVQRLAGQDAPQDHANLWAAPGDLGGRPNSTRSRS